MADILKSGGASTYRALNSKMGTSRGYAGEVEEKIILSKIRVIS